MTIIESIRNFILKCPYLDEFNEGLGRKKVGVDFLSDEIESYSIEEVPAGPIIKRYTDGSSLRQIIFVFSSRECYGENVLQNLDNIGFYHKFSEWLEEQTENDNLPIIQNGTSQKIEALTNGYAFDTDVNKARYQIQVKLTYIKDK